jgi:carbon-monoxide dehydrogenase medium subunit
VTLPPFDYARPRSLDEAAALLRSRDHARVLAGGQSLVPALAARLPGEPRPGLLVDLSAIPGLDAIEPRPDGGVRIGAMVRQRTVETSPLIAQRAPLLAAAVAWVGHPSTRNRGTVVGSLAHAEPRAELPAVAVALDAVAELAGPDGSRRTVAAAELLSAAAPAPAAATPAPPATATPAPPATATPARPAATPAPLGPALAPGELIAALTIPPRPAGERTAWVEHAARRYDLPLVGVAAVVRADGTARLVFAGLGPAPVVLDARSIEGRIDTRTTALPAPDALRGRIARVLAERALAEARHG